MTDNPIGYTARALLSAYSLEVRTTQWFGDFEQLDGNEGAMSNLYDIIRNNLINLREALAQCEKEVDDE